MRNPYRIYLRPNTTSYYAIGTGGQPITQTGAYDLPIPPSSWDSIEVTDQRNLRYFGYERKYSAAYKFVEEGAKILRYIWYTYGRKAKCILQVEKLNTTTQLYESFFTTDLNFRTAKDEDTHFSIEIMQDGLQGLLKSQENVDYEIWLYGNGVINVELPSFRIKGRAQFMSSWPVPAAGTDLNSFVVGLGQLPFFLYVDKTTIRDSTGVQPIGFGNDIVNVGGATSANVGIIGQLPTQVNLGSPVISYDNNYLFKANINLYNVKMSGVFPVFLQNESTTGTNTFTFRISKINASNVVTDISQQTVILAAGANTNYTYTFNIPAFNLNAGDMLKVLITKGGGSGGGNTNTFRIAWENRRDLEIRFEQDSVPVVFKGMRMYNAVQNVVNKVTDGQATFSSALLTSSPNYNQNYEMKPNNLVISSTNAICGLLKPDSNNVNASTFKSSFADIFKCIDSLQSAGMSITGNTVNIERKSYFMNPSNLIFTIDKPVDVRVSPAAEFLYNTMKIGYPSQDYDGLNGLEEFNTEQLWKFCKVTTLTDNIKELDLTNPFRADVFGIYYTWINNILLNTDGYNSGTSSASNNETFVLEVADTPNGSGNYPIKNWPGGLIYGVSDPSTAFNIGLSPKRCLIRNGRFLQAILHGMESDMIKYVSQEKNNKVTSSLGSGTIDEDADQPISALSLVGSKLFLPYIAEVDCVSPENYVSIINTNPTGFIRVTNWKGQTFEGFPLLSGLKPSYPEANYTFNLLLSPNTNVTNLIF